GKLPKPFPYPEPFFTRQSWNSCIPKPDNGFKWSEIYRPSYRSFSVRSKSKFVPATSLFPESRVSKKGAENERALVLIQRYLGGRMLKTQSKVLAAVLLVTGALILAGCPTRTTIEKINRDPGRYAGKEVTIAGHV